MTRLEELLDKQRKLEEQIKAETEKAEVGKMLAGVMGNVADIITKGVKDVKILDGKTLTLTVNDAGKLVVVFGKGNGNGNGHKAEANGNHANGNGNGNHDYYLKDGRGPFADIQAAMDAMGIDKDSRPKHTRYARLSKEWQDKIEMRDKVAVTA